MPYNFFEKVYTIQCIIIHIMYYNRKKTVKEMHLTLYTKFSIIHRYQISNN